MLRVGNASKSQLFGEGIRLPWRQDIRFRFLPSLRLLKMVDRNSYHDATEDLQEIEK